MLRDNPELCVNYSPDFDLRITCVTAQRYESAFSEYFFEVKCRLWHPSGFFDYRVDHLCFEPNSFARFSEELRCVQQGTADRAALKNLGGMFVFQLDRNGRELKLTLNVREYIPPHGLATMGTVLDVDYDLFVNKLLEEVGQFVKVLHDVETDEL